MAKKKNPEQEAPPMEDQEPETPTEQEETPAQEEQPQDQEQDTEEQEDAEEDTPEEEENPQEELEEPPQEQPPTHEPAADETAALRSQLLNAQGRLAAYAAGVTPDMVDDAVTLAMAEAAKSGEVTETSVNSAMDSVLRRHPEWKADSGKKRAGGFRIGTDRDNSGSGKQPGATTQNVKRWNRFKNN